MLRYRYIFTEYGQSFRWNQAVKRFLCYKCFVCIWCIKKKSQEECQCLHSWLLKVQSDLVLITSNGFPWSVAADVDGWMMVSWLFCSFWQEKNALMHERQYYYCTFILLDSIILCVNAFKPNCCLSWVITSPTGGSPRFIPPGLNWASSIWCWLFGIATWIQFWMYYVHGITHCISMYNGCCKFKSLCH